MDATNTPRRIYSFDTSLRDGCQAEGISLSIEDKLRIVERLDAFGIDFIECGYPASNPKDIELYRALSSLKLRHSKLVAFGSTCKKGVAASEDAGLQSLLSSGVEYVALVGKTWDIQIEQALLTSLDENLRMIYDSVSFLTSQGMRVIFDAEHYFDGYKSNPECALACIHKAYQAGAVSIDLCDTNGGSLPFEIERIVEETLQALPGIPLGIHCHNDTGCAVANTLAALRAGASQFQGTINGYGERVGNTDLLVTIANLELKSNCTCVGKESLKSLTELARFVAATCNMALPKHHPYVGSCAFAHKGGLHASAQARLPYAYEHLQPSMVGNNSRTLVSELAGKASLIAKARQLGINLTEYKSSVQEILDDIKQRESCGCSFEAADGSLALLIRSHLGIFKPHFTLESFRVIVDDHEDVGSRAKDAQSEATVKIHVGDKRFVTTGEGAGPVGALDRALRLALIQTYPELDNIELVDYKVRILDENVGTSAITRVQITTRDSLGSWGTIGVSENIIEASWNALVDSLEYGLLRFKEEQLRQSRAMLENA